MLLFCYTMLYRTVLHQTVPYYEKPYYTLKILVGP